MTDVLSGGGGHPVGRLPAPSRLLLVAVLVLLGVGDLQARRLEVDGLPLREQVELQALAAQALASVAGEVSARRLRIATSYAPPTG